LTLVAKSLAAIVVKEEFPDVCKAEVEAPLGRLIVNGDVNFESIDVKLD